MTRKKTNSLAHVLTKLNLTVFVKAGQRTVSRDHMKFKELMDAVMAGDENAVENILDPYKTTKHASGLFDVNGFGEASIDGFKLPKALSERLVEFHTMGHPLTPLLKLWKNILANPDKTAATDLYDYLEYNGHPITPDGCFIAYRAVEKEIVDGVETGRLIDNYSRTMDNSVGTVVKMKRDLCDGDRNNTCSRGLHAANMDYVKGSYPGKVVVNVKINPKDVVAIPTDYSNHKMRCCEFKIVSVNEELTEMKGLQVVDNETIDEYGDEEFDAIQDELGAVAYNAGLVQEDMTQESWKLQKRDANGRFTSGKKRKG